MNLDGIIVKLQIQHYTKKEARIREEYDNWCKASFSFFAEPWLDYHKENKEIFLSFEIDELAQALDDLLHDKISQPTIVEFIEPDFLFELSPKEDLRDNPRVVYIRPGKEITDISMKWEISFWNDGLTANYLTLTLDREDMVNLKNYLWWVIGKYDETTPEIIAMKAKGILY